MPETKNNSILLVLRIPPPFGGGEIVSKILYEELENKFNFLLIKREGHTKEKQSQTSLSNYFHGVNYIFRIASALIFQRPKAIYIGLPKTYAAFARNSSIIYLASLLNIKVLAELHGMSLPFISTTKGRKLFERTIKRVFAIRVLSQSIGLYLRDNGYNGNIYVVDNGIRRPIELNKIKKTDSLNLLYLGAISEAKGFDNLIELAILLKAQNLKFKLNVIGEWVNPKYKKASMKIISTKNLDGDFHFHGFLGGDIKWQAIIENNFLLHLTKFDGQPLAIIEALSLGIPVFAYKVGGIPEMLTHGKDGFLVNNVAEIAQLLSEIKEEKLSYSDLQTNALATYAKRFTPQIMAEKITRMIEESTK